MTAGISSLAYTLAVITANTSRKHLPRKIWSRPQQSMELPTSWAVQQPTLPVPFLSLHQTMTPRFIGRNVQRNQVWCFLFGVKIIDRSKFLHFLACKLCPTQQMRTSGIKLRLAEWEFLSVGCCSVFLPHHVQLMAWILHISGFLHCDLMLWWLQSELESLHTKKIFN